MDVSSVQFSSVTQLCPTLCDPMNRRMPVLPDVQIPEREERRLPRQCNSQKKGKFITDLSQGSCRTSSTVVRGSESPEQRGLPKFIRYA